ncbi:AAA family ATPase [Legionella gresilensis]|uniref:AAA family ATPase n=1 Tax=Legionella gresilensis TaxID=91823 RepID=UPI00104199FB|nr:AAA family ATPase [Legionella gresilensis]
MRICKLTVENVKNFLNRAELILDDNISIIIGPNGGGKSNLLDILVIVVRKYVSGTQCSQLKGPEVQYVHNEKIDTLILERHSLGGDKKQIIEIEIEVTIEDKEKMLEMKSSAQHLLKISGSKYSKSGLVILTEAWDLNLIQAGEKFKFKIEDNTFSIVSKNIKGAEFFRTYISLCERYEEIRDKYEGKPFVTPFIFLPANRSTNFETLVELNQYDEYELKKAVNSATSRSNSRIINLALGQLIQKYRSHLDNHVNPIEYLNNLANIKELNKFLNDLGYSWNIICKNSNTNQYELELKKNGQRFLISSASSGEIELLTYLFVIYFLNVREAVIIIDEAELHLHPHWQKLLFDLFIKLSKKTHNQFIISTHSPSFITPSSIEFVSRVFSFENQSKIIRLNKQDFPNAKHLLQIINSQNNEIVFFADEVVLVEGVSDRIFFKALFNYFYVSNPKSVKESPSKVIEFIEVGGKNRFKIYMKLLQLLCIKCAIIADLDYILDLDPSTFKPLFKVNNNKLKKSLCDSASKDGTSFLEILEGAIETKNLKNLQEMWVYLKGRHQRLRNDLKPYENQIIDNYIKQQKDDGCYILRKGSLEKYLPDDCKGKDINKIIKLINKQNFISDIPPEVIAELRDIITAIIGMQDLK